MSKLVGPVLALAGLVLSAQPASADPIAASTFTYPFSVGLVQVPPSEAEGLFGREMTVGDTLSGALVFSTIGPGEAFSPNLVDYELPDARVQFDVPNGFSMTATAAEPYHLRVWDLPANGGAPDSLQLLITLSGPLFIDWLDYSGRALTNPHVPTSTSGFGVESFQLADIYGRNAPPTPEPSTVLLLGTGIVVLGRRISWHKR